MPTLSSFLGIGHGSVVSLVGAGGKTTTMFRLAHELNAMGLTVITTTTTNIQRPAPGQSPLLLLLDDVPNALAAVGATVEQYRHITAVGCAGRADKLSGIEPSLIPALGTLADVVLVEADGARHHAIKAPAPHEPVVPEVTTHFLSLVGLHALGRPLEAVCHRPEIAARIAGQEMDAPITATTIARLLASPDGGLRGKPEAAHAWAVLTHLDTANESEARAVAASLRHGGYTGVVGLSRAGDFRSL